MQSLNSFTQENKFLICFAKIVWNSHNFANLHYYKPCCNEHSYNLFSLSAPPKSK